MLYNISCGIKLLLKKSEENSKTKKKKIKKGEQDDNTIAQAAASSLLALVNGLDKKSNNFNQLDKMQIHMSKLITEQEGKVEASNKKDSEIINQLEAKSGQDKSPSSSSSEDDTFATPTGLKKQFFCEIGSDED